LQWTPAASIEVDVEDFTSSLAAARATTPQDGDDETIACLRRAVACYAGDLLEGSYDEWLVEARERLRDQYVAALADLAALLSARGDHVEAVRMGRELVRREPVREASHQLLMALHDASGDRAAAVRAYHECVTTLHRELGVEPSRETAAAYAVLTRPGPAAVDEGPVVATRRAGLVGREREWGTLTSAWRGAASGRPQLVVVSGEPGVGKTRLVEELAEWSAHQGAVVASGRAYPTEGELGFGLAISWLRGGLRERVRRASSADRAELGRLLPELDPSPAAERPVADQADRRHRLFDAIARVVVGDGRPVMLVADDAQWTDAPSLQALHYLLRYDRTASLLAVATVRREDLDASHALVELLDALAVADRLTELTLDRLTPAATAALAAQLTDREVAADDTDELFAHTEGNPLFVVESVRAGWPASGTATLSPRLQAVISARIRQLTPPARDLLGVAAAVGRDVTVPLLREASSLDERTLVLSLDELWRRGLVREHGADGYDFSHGRIRDAVYGELEPAVRRHHHVVVAASLQRLHEPDVEAVSGQIAVHHDRAGRPHEAVAWYQRGAAEAQRRSANAEAVRLLERALELVDELPATDRAALRLEVLSALPTPLAGTEGFASERLATTQRRALDLAAALGLRPQPPVLRSVVMSRLCRDDFEGAVAAAGQLRDEALRARDDGLAVESTYLLGIGAFWGGRLEAARDLFGDVVASFRPEQRSRHLVRFGQDPQVVCLSRLGNTLRFLGDLDGARRARDEAVAMADTIGHPFSRGAALIFAVLLTIDLGEDDRLLELVDALRRDPHPARPNDVKTEALTGYAEIVAGRTGAGFDRLRRAVATSGPVNHAPGFRAALLRVVVAAEVRAGDPEDGLAVSDEALQAGGTRLWEADVRLARARFLDQLDRPAEEVDAELGRALAAARSIAAEGPAHLIEQRQRERSRAG
jgi:tetratricopeptide (TPR) repeat protein